MSEDLESVAATLVADGKGILAADESVATSTRRFDTVRDPVHRAEPARVPRDAVHHAGRGRVHQRRHPVRRDHPAEELRAGRRSPRSSPSQGIVPGIKVDTGAEPLAGSPEETVTEGLDGLRDRLAEYHGMGARFAKWRAVIRITDRLPSVACVSANAHALARYAALCQEQQLVPIVEPEVLMNGAHTIERCEEVTGTVLHAVFHALFSLAEVRWDLVIVTEAHWLRGARAEALRRIITDAERAILATIPLPGLELADEFASENMTEVVWQRDKVVGHDGKPLDAAKRPVLHEVAFSLTPAEVSLRETMADLCRVIGGKTEIRNFIAKVLLGPTAFQSGRARRCVAAARRTVEGPGQHRR